MKPCTDHEITLNVPGTRRSGPGTHVGKVAAGCFSFSLLGTPRPAGEKDFPTLHMAQWSEYLYTRRSAVVCSTRVDSHHLFYLSLD